MKTQEYRSLVGIFLLMGIFRVDAYDFQSGGIYYEINGEEVTVTRESAFEPTYEGDVVIPSIVSYDGENYSVTSIGNWAFEGCANLKKLTLPESLITIDDYSFSGCKRLGEVIWSERIEVIGKYAFSGCISLQSIVIPASVKRINEGVFNGCTGLESVVMGDSVEYVGSSAFLNCTSLESVSPGDAVNYIGEGAFSSTSLESVMIPASVATIEANPFVGSLNLKEITVSEENLAYSSLDGVLYNKDRTTLCACPGGKSSIEIPLSVEHIGPSAFCACAGLLSVTIPPTVESIEASAFGYCKELTSVTIGKSVSRIGEYAFDRCDNLQDIYIYAELPPVIDANTFEDYEATLYVPAGSKSAYQKASYWSNFTNIMESPTGVESVDNNDMRVYAAGHTLYVEHVDEAYRVYTAMGQLVYAGDESTVLLPGAGLYIVCAGNRSQKVWVK